MRATKCRWPPYSYTKLKRQRREQKLRLERVAKLNANIDALRVLIRKAEEQNDKKQITKLNSRIRVLRQQLVYIGAT